MKSIRFKKLLFLLFTLFLTLLLVVACGNNDKTDDGSGSSPDNASGKESKGGYTITYMTTQARMKDSLKEMADLMEEEENIKVEFEVIPDPQFISLLQTKIASGEVPDVVDLNTPAVFESFDYSENFEELSNEEWVSRLNNPDQFKYDGGHYSFPYAAPGNVIGAIYNKDLFNELGVSIPETYDEFLEVLREIKDVGKDPLFLSSKDTWTTQTPMLVFTNALLSDKSEDTWEQIVKNELSFADVPEFQQALKDYQALIEEDLVNKNYMTATYDMAKEAVASGEAAMMISGEFAIKDIASKWPDTEIGFFAVPYNNTDSIVTANISWSVVVMKNGKQLEQTKEWLNLWSQPKYQNIYFEENPGLPGPADVNGGDLPPALEDAYDNYLKQGKATVQMNDYFDIAGLGNWLDDKLFPFYNEVLMGKDIDEVIEDIDKTLDEFGKAKQIPGF